MYEFLNFSMMFFYVGEIYAREERKLPSKSKEIKIYHFFREIATFAEMSRTIKMIIPSTFYLNLSHLFRKC